MTGAKHEMVRDPKVVLHAGRGHAFRSYKKMAGPMDQEAENMLVADLLRMLEVG